MKELTISFRSNEIDTEEVRECIEDGLGVEILSIEEEIKKLYIKLTDTFTEKEQFKLLNELIDVEIELESYCNV